MRDESFHTDREVGEFIEGLRASSRSRKRGLRSGYGSSPRANDQNAELLSMIQDMEQQLQTLSQNQSQSDFPLEAPRRANRRSDSRERYAATGNRNGARGGQDYRGAIDRIEAQLARVDQALDRNKPSPASRLARTASDRNRSAERFAAYADAPQSGRNLDGVDMALRQIMERVESLAPDLQHGLQQVKAQDDKINLLRDDVASLRDLLDHANYAGASERMLNEIATLSGRIESLSHAVTETRQDPQMLDAMRDIHALLDRPAQDPSLDQHFDRILGKLDNLPNHDHYEDFAKLSAQIDHLRDMVAAAPRAQHMSDISGQMGMMVERLGALEDNLRHVSTSSATNELSTLLGNRLATLQDQIERLDPNDRLMRLEDQLAAFADRLESNRDFSDVQKPMEILARQMESLVDLVDQRDQNPQQDALAQLAQRVADLDDRLQQGLTPTNHDQRFDHVERTLARIDDVLAQRMGSTDLSGLENGLSRLADRMEAQEAALSKAPAQAGQMNMAGLNRLEGMIADLADRLDSAAQNTHSGGDQQFFETLTSRLDSLAEQFAQSQNRFEAVDRLGADIQQLAKATPKAPVNQAKLAEAAAVRALQKVGPLSAGPEDGAFEAIVDGLKDDLQGLRRLAETSETTTQESLTSVSSMLQGIADRLTTLEEDVRNKEVHAPETVAIAPVVAVAEDAEEEKPARGLGRLLRRGKKAPKEASTTVSEDTPKAQMSAQDLLAQRTGRGGKRGAVPQASAPSVNVQGTSEAPRQAGISLTGKAAQASAAKASQPQARQGQAPSQAQPSVQGNVLLKPQPDAQAEAQPAAQPQRRMAQIVDRKGEGPAINVGAGAGASKADFIAAARRAAQAAAQESERVEKEETEKRSFLSRFKGSKKAKAKDGEIAEATPQATDAPIAGKNRKERRAAIAEAARKAKQVKDLDSAELVEQLDNGEASAMVGELLEDEQTRKSLFARIGSTVSRHSRPLLMAAAAILLAITTLQLVQNPNSSLHALFNKDAVEQTEPVIEQPALDQGDATIAPADANNQSSLAPSSGNLMPPMEAEEANRAITFAAPSGAQETMAGPRIPEAEKPQASDSVATFTPESTVSMPGITPGVGDGVDLTPTSSIPRQPTAAHEQLQKEAANQPLPPAPTALTNSNASIDPSVQAAIDMNNLLAPGLSDSPLLAAAKDGDALAQFEMGRRLTLGEGMSADLQEAASWFEKAAAQSMPQAQYSLANLYEKGKGVKRDFQVARLWYERAAKAGNIKAMHNLAVLHAEGGLGKPDFKKASHWFIQAADHGLKDSQYNLAILYARGMGIEQDLLQSYKWFAIAAQNGDKGALSKRDEVFAVLNKAQRKTAMALVAKWVAKVGKPSANKLANIPDSWKNKAPSVVTSIAPNGSDFMVNQGTIAKAQSMLGALGYNAGPADGQIGPRTRTAIRNFQEVAGLPVTGQIDKALLEALSMRVI